MDMRSRKNISLLEYAFVTACSSFLYCNTDAISTSFGRWGGGCGVCGGWVGFFYTSFFGGGLAARYLSPKIQEPLDGCLLAEMEAFAELNAGSASDHFRMSMAHMRRCTALLFGCDRNENPYRPFNGASVTNQTQIEPMNKKSSSTALSKAIADEEVEPRSCCVGDGYVVLPTESWKESWDGWILLLILYSAVTVPYRICFDAAAEGHMWYFEQVVTGSFLIDVTLNFNTAFLHEQAWVTDRSQIAQNYLRGWFWIDAPASVPIELVGILLGGDTTNLAALRFLRLFRLLRLLRLLKLGEYISALEIKFDLNLTFLRIVQLVMALCFLAHMLGAPRSKDSPSYPCAPQHHPNRH